jgi:flagellin
MKQARAVLTRLADAAVTGDSRIQYESQYTLLVNQIGSFIDDAFYNGRTLLSTTGPSGGNIVSIRNETGGTFTINAVDGAGLKLLSAVPTTAALAVARLTSGTGDFDVKDAAISSALNSFGAQMQFVENQQVYNSKKVDALNDGLGALVDADLAKESSNLQALQTRQELGLQTLSLANQGPQVLLSLFR